VMPALAGTARMPYRRSCSTKPQAHQPRPGRTPEPTSNIDCGCRGFAPGRQGKTATLHVRGPSR
jgi:hypothetical protein